MTNLQTTKQLKERFERALERARKNNNLSMIIYLEKNIENCNRIINKNEALQVVENKEVENQFTTLENEVINIIKNDLECGWSSNCDDTYDCCYNPFYQTNNRQHRGALSSLVKKGVIEVVSTEEKNDTIAVLKMEYFR